MAFTLNAFQRLLVQVPKTDKSPQQIYEDYLTNDSRLPIESFFGMKMEMMIARHADRQDKYDQLWAKYKEVAGLLQQLFDLSNPSS
mmetsp:Transcript_3167/g.6549  ORF Transcript_3167/g.6549 Transcript_3167/m.6549 type:complete len:86 (-) Transcript_3167:1182-1439(-)